MQARALRLRFKAPAKPQYLGDAAARAEIGRMNESADSCFTSDWNFPAVLRCDLLRSGSRESGGFRIAAGEPIPFGCCVAHGQIGAGN